MYTPAAFLETRIEVMEAAMTVHPLAAVVTMASNRIEASHIPLLYARSENGFGVLRGHMARANPQWKEYLPGAEALAIFNGPQHYVSPGWYPSAKEHGKVVPTWNYVVVHARGTLLIHENREWLLENVRMLTDRHEAGMERPWGVDDAPADYIENLTRAIVGIEMIVSSLEGKWKVSQNRSDADRLGVIGGLQALASSEALSMAHLVETALKTKK